MKVNQPTLEFFSPMAWSMPWTGKGVKTSHLRKPASRTFSAACMTEAVVRNSAIMPKDLEGFSAMGALLSRCVHEHRSESGRGLAALQNAVAPLEAVRDAARFWSAVSPLPLLDSSAKCVSYCRE